MFEIDRSLMVVKPILSSDLYEHECKIFLARFTSAFAVCPCCDEPIGPPPSFPVFAAEFLNKISEKCKISVAFDILEIENNLLVRSPDGELLVIPNGFGKTGAILLPKRTRFSDRKDYELYSGLYDCDKPIGGEVRILSPTVVDETTGGWLLRERGRLDIIPAGAATKVSEAAEGFPISVADYSKSIEGANVVEHDLVDHILKLDPTGPKANPPPQLPEGPVTLVEPDVPSKLSLQRGVIVCLAVTVTFFSFYGAITLVRNLLSSIIPGAHRNEQIPTPAPTPLNRTAPAGMILIPGGEFLMGQNGPDKFERPAHKVAVNPFYIDVTEVTCEEYEKFVKATGHKAPAGWINGTYPSGSARKPVTGVDWNDASAYAQWAKRRLPTEEEWEFAARGTDNRKYPWGNDWQVGSANAHKASKGLEDVGAYKGMSPFGAYDMVGNAWEWTASRLVAYPGGRLPADVPSGDRMVIRGGSWQEDRTEATATYRAHLKRVGDEDYNATGFRCVKDISVPNQD